MPRLPRTFTHYLRVVCAVAALAAAYACDSRTPTDPALALTPVPLRGNESGDAELGSISLTPTGSYSQFATIPENAWALVRVSGKWIVEANPACAGQPPNWPCSSLAPYSGYDLEYPDAFRGPVRLATVSPTGSFDFLELRGSGGPDEGIGLTQREFSRDVLASPALLNPSVQQFGTTGPSVASYIIDGSYMVTVTRIASPIRVTEGAAEADGSRTYTVEPLYGLKFINPLGSFEPPGAVRWFFVPGEDVDPVAPNSDPPWTINECRNLTSCRWTPPGPGRVQVSASVETLRARARSVAEAICESSSITASTSCGDAQPELLVTCSPAAPLRGQDVSCTASVTENASFEVVRQVASGDGFRNAENVNVSYPGGAVHRWDGPAVATTRVRFTVTIHGERERTETKDGSFTPTARTWADFSIATPTSRNVKYEIIERMTPYPLPRTMLGGLGMHGLEGTSMHLRRVTGGPNKDLVHLQDRPNLAGLIGATVYLHPALYARCEGEPGCLKWAPDQNQRGSGTCTQAELPLLRTEIERHEGMTGADSSHVGVANYRFARDKPQNDLESLYRWRMDDDQRFKQVVYDRYRRYVRGTLDRAHDAFDTQDYPHIWGLFSCEFDFNPHDN